MAGPRRAPGKKAAQVLRQNAIAFLLFLRLNPGTHTPTAVTRGIASETKYATATARRLKKAGLVDLNPGPVVAGKPTQRIFLTDRGKAIADQLIPIVRLLEGQP
jgi:DNA-binding MarR family transcriptional regulator